MTMTLARSGATLHVALSDELCIADADAIHQALFAELDADVSLRVDAAGVTRLDTGVAQVLVAASRRVKEIRVEAVSAEWVEAWRVLGLSLVPPVALAPKAAC